MCAQQRNVSDEAELGLMLTISFSESSSSRTASLLPGPMFVKVWTGKLWLPMVPTPYT